MLTKLQFNVLDSFEGTLSCPWTCQHTTFDLREFKVLTACSTARVFEEPDALTSLQVAVPSHNERHCLLVISEAESVTCTVTFSFHVL
jgi:hypothetical protein